MRFQELEALALLHGISRDTLYGDQKHPTQLIAEPYIFVNLPLEVVDQILSRSVLIKFIIEVWGEGLTLEDTMNDVNQRMPLDARCKYFNPPNSMAIRINLFGNKITVEEKKQRYDQLRVLFTGDEKIDLNAPDNVLWLVEDYGAEEAPEAKRIFIGLQIGVGRSTDKAKGDIAFYRKYELNKRCVLGPTTLDNELAFLMANMALVSQKSAQVMDPFCGTGGILVSLAHFLPSVCLGNDIDIRVLKGWKVAYTKNKEMSKKIQNDRGHKDKGINNIFTNFEQYDLPRPEIVACDNSANCWRKVPFLDSVVTDPPYGIRARSKKIQTTEEHEVRDRETYIPQCEIYEEKDVLLDLFEFGSVHLRDHGRLVYLLPVDLMQIKEGTMQVAQSDKRKLVMEAESRENRLWASELTRDPDLLDETRYDLPDHPDFNVIGASLQVLSGGLGRLLVTMERKERS